MDLNPLEDTSVAEEVRTINGNLISNLKANEGYHSPSNTLSHWIFPVLLGDEPLEKVEAFKKVYAELAVINKKLQIQSIILQKQKMELTQRERALVECQQGRSFDIRQSNMQTSKVEHELTVKTEKQQHDLDKLTAQLQNKNKEMKRMRASFDNLKEVNVKLRRKFMEVQEQNRKLELQVVSVQGRLTNLLRKQSLADRPRDPRSALARTQAKTCQQMAISPKKEANKTSTSNKPPIKETAAVYDVLAFLLEWLCEVHLVNIVTDASCSINQPHIFPPSHVVSDERCIKILPFLVEVLPSGSSKMHLPCLQFIYWSLVHLDQGLLSQKPNLHSTTYRHIGEVLYKPLVTKCAQVEDGNNIQEPLKPNAAIFIKSSNLDTRFLSSLIILKTLSQVDCLMKVFEILRRDLQDDSAKKMFLSYRATQVVVPFMKVPNNTLMANAVDVFLQMSVESQFIQEFLDSCSNEQWFRACATLLHKPDIDHELWEKLSVILQKLSKVKNNKHHFDVQGITRIIKEALRVKGKVNPFLSLNLRSILLNL